MLLKSLPRKKINITNLIIDDNWQSINRGSRSWVQFEADSNAFPNGLKHAISSIRQKQPSLQNVAVWHALWGYWNGIYPNGKIAKTYKTVNVTSEGQQRNVVAKEDIGKLYEDFYQFLSSCGVDGVNGVKTEYVLTPRSLRQLGTHITIAPSATLILSRGLKIAEI